MAYNYGKVFKKDGKSVRYRYTNKDPKTKKLVSYNPKRKNTRRKTKKWVTCVLNAVLIKLAVSKLMIAMNDQFGISFVNDAIWSG